MEKTIIFTLSLLLMPIAISCSNNFDNVNIVSKYPDVLGVNDNDYDDYGCVFYLYSDDNSNLSKNADNSINCETYRELRLFMYYKNNDNYSSENIDRYMKVSFPSKTVITNDTYSKESLFRLYCFYFTEVSNNSNINITYNNEKTYKLGFNIKEYSSFDEDYQTVTKSEAEQRIFYNSLKSIKLYDSLDYSLIENEIQTNNSSPIRISQDYPNAVNDELLETINLSSNYKYINKTMLLPKSFDLYSIHTQREDEELFYTKDMSVGYVNVTYDKEISTREDYENAKMNIFSIFVSKYRNYYQKANKKLFYGTVPILYTLNVDKSSVCALIIENKNKMYVEQINGVDVVFYKYKNNIYAVYEFDSNYYRYSSAVINK